MMPTSSEMITVRVPKMIPVFGSVKPIAVKNPNRPFASRSPRKRPVTDAIVPITSASMKIDRRTWPRVAPRVRSVANSRVRCAIVIESEFAITKLPTKSAMPPNASRKPRRNEMNESVSLASSAACWAPVRTCAFAGRTDRTWSTSCWSETVGLAAMSISSNWPGLSNSRCAVGTSKPASVAPPMSSEPVPNLTMPEILSRTTGPSA